MYRKRFSLVASVALLFGAAAAFLAPPKAEAQQLNNYTLSLTNLPTYVATAGVSNLMSQPFNIRPGYGIGCQVYFAGTNTGTANLQLQFDLATTDTTNFTTTAPLIWNVPMNGATGQRAYTNFPPWLLDGARAIRVTAVTNAHTASLFLTNIVLSRGVPWPPK